ncbi:MAG: MFS transporter [Desulfobacteraceae bacterium]|nr:MFS transporter [Desulfobacteraceae bacterium]
MTKSLQTLVGISIASTLIGIDFAVVNTALPVIQHTFNAPISHLQWLISGFGLLYCPLMIVMGRLGDLRGRRIIFYSGVIGLIVFSLGAGLSHSIFLLIVMRLLQGLSAAMALPCSMSIATVIFPEEKNKVRALAFIGSMMGIGMAFGPVLGSFIVTFLNWRWIFFINVPLGLLALLICLPNIEESKMNDGQKIQWTGVCLLITSLTLFLFSISQSPVYGWHSPIIFVSFLLSLVIFMVFIMLERRNDSPLIPLRRLANRNFFSGVITYIGGTGPCWAVMFLMPLYLHNILGLSMEHVGIMLFIMTIMTFIAPILGGQYYSMFGASHVVKVLCVTISMGLFLFLMFEPHSSIWLILIAFILFGTGWGLGNAISMPLGVSQSNHEDSGLIAGSLTTIAATSGIVLLTIAVTLFDYGKQIFSFMIGFRMAFGFLLLICVILFIVLMIIRRNIRLQNGVT